MCETVWFNQPKILFQSDKILQFWPTSNQSSAERVNSSTRFILYSMTLLYLLRRDIRFLIFGLMIISVLYILYKGGMVKEGHARPTESDGLNFGCQLPTEQNPMSNYLLGDSPTKPPACFYPTVKPLVNKYLDRTIPYDCGRSRCSLPVYQQNAAARQFISSPVTTSVNDQTEFAEWCYGKKNRPMCRDDPTQCNPDIRGVQLEAFAGLDPSGDMRTGMSNRGATGPTGGSP